MTTEEAIYILKNSAFLSTVSEYQEVEEATKMAIKALEKQIPVKPSVGSERKPGKWTIKNGELAFWDVCSECGKMVLHKAPFYSYCPNCGCQMNGGEQDDSV